MLRDISIAGGQRCFSPLPVSVDLFLLGLVALFAILGAFSGAARQVAHLIALTAAYLCARPLGQVVGPPLAKALELSATVGSVLSTLGVFLIVLLGIRALLTWVFRRVLAGKDPQDRRLDRGLGFALGGVKAALALFVALCAVTFIEENVAVAGRKLVVAPKGSIAFELSRRFNVFELAPAAAAEDLLEVARAASDPERVAQLRKDPSFQALRKDPRFQRALADTELRRALEAGDVHAVLRSRPVVELLEDPDAAARLAAAAAILGDGRLRGSGPLPGGDASRTPRR